ncbi:hypothetical protein DENSPDRAFT_696146 [Dentipellis sp. KUC8613]|nr:hypothetical protein DENSPDRAFT_696146 [Dentipellis sp. KUC8613]
MSDDSPALCLSSSLSPAPLVGRAHDCSSGQIQAVEYYMEAPTSCFRRRSFKVKNPYLQQTFPTVTSEQPFPRSSSFSYTQTPSYLGWILTGIDTIPPFTQLDSHTISQYKSVLACGPWAPRSLPRRGSAGTALALHRGRVAARRLQAATGLRPRSCSQIMPELTLRVGSRGASCRAYENILRARGQWCRHSPRI